MPPKPRFQNGNDRRKPPPPPPGRGPVMTGQQTNGFAAQQTNSKAAVVFSKTKLCKFNAAGMCARGERCQFAHSETDLKAAPDLYRTQMCQKMIESGICGDAYCRFAHTKSELRHVSFNKNNRSNEVPQLNRSMMAAYAPIAGNIIGFVPATAEFNAIACGSNMEGSHQSWIQYPVMPQGNFTNYGNASQIGWTPTWTNQVTSSTWSKDTGLEDKSGKCSTGDNDQPDATPKSSRVQVIIKNTFVHALEFGASEEDENRKGPPSMFRSSSSPPTTPMRSCQAAPSPHLMKDVNAFCMPPI